VCIYIYIYTHTHIYRNSLYDNLLLETQVKKRRICIWNT
jgi:hypothetical protein